MIIKFLNSLMRINNIKRLQVFIYNFEIHCFNNQQLLNSRQITECVNILKSRHFVLTTCLAIHLIVYFLISGDQVSLTRGAANSDNPVECSDNQCGFTGFLMKPTN